MPDKECCANCRFYVSDGKYCDYWAYNVEYLTGEKDDLISVCPDFERARLKEDEYEDEEGTQNLKPIGDNYPTYKSLIVSLGLRKERTTMVKKLLNTENKRITKDDIIDMQIDLYLYDKGCRKEKIKRIYKRKKKE